MVSELLEVSIRSIFYFLEALPNLCENENKKEEFLSYRCFAFLCNLLEGSVFFSVFAFCLSQLFVSYH